MDEATWYDRLMENSTEPKPPTTTSDRLQRARDERAKRLAASPDARRFEQLVRADEREADRRSHG